METPAATLAADADVVQVAVETTKTMSDLSPYPPHSRRPFDYWALVIIGMCCLALVVWLKTLGVILSLGIIAALYWAFKLRTSAPEAISLQRSIDLSRADIVDVVDFLALCDGCVDGCSLISLDNCPAVNLSSIDFVVDDVLFASFLFFCFG